MTEQFEGEMGAAREAAAANIATRREAAVNRIAGAGNLRALSEHAAESLSQFEAEEGKPDSDATTAHDKRVQRDSRVHDRVLGLIGSRSLSRSR